jgi:hypothetical protein
MEGDSERALEEAKKKKNSQAICVNKSSINETKK